MLIFEREIASNQKLKVLRGKSQNPELSRITYGVGNPCEQAIDRREIPMTPIPTRLGSQLTEIAQCPHCGVSSPVLLQRWHSKGPVARADGGAMSVWAAYACTTCGHIVTAKGLTGRTENNPPVESIFPAIWSPHSALPERVANYLRQAWNTLRSPDASVLMSASAIDAMLKLHELRDGTLYVRIDQAVANGVLTKAMAQWAHRVRLDANNPRHADDNEPHLSLDEARRAFDFAEALGEYLYALPSRMPPSTG